MCLGLLAFGISFAAPCTALHSGHLRMGQLSSSGLSPWKLLSLSLHLEFWLSSLLPLPFSGCLSEVALHQPACAGLDFLL